MILLPFGLSILITFANHSAPGIWLSVSFIRKIHHLLGEGWGAVQYWSNLSTTKLECHSLRGHRIFPGVS